MNTGTGEATTSFLPGIDDEAYLHALEELRRQGDLSPELEADRDAVAEVAID